MRLMIGILASICLILLISCSPQQVTPTGHFNKAFELDYALLADLPQTPISYQQQIKPILNHRCAVCHSCYDAPCQLKLNSWSGIQRGASQQAVYQSRRLFAQSPTRLDIDAHTISQWRDLNFFAALNGDNALLNQLFQAPDRQTAIKNLNNSLLYQVIRHKQQNPQPRHGALAKNIRIGLNHQYACPNLQQYDKFRQQNPHAGMPYALPELNKNEYKTLVQWLAQGSPFDEIKNRPANKLLSEWEHRLNMSDPKHRLIARYLYEHLFSAHIYFSTQKNPRWYRLVRSKTAAPEAIDEIATRRPFDDPGKTFYYRFKPFLATPTIKTHRPFLMDRRQFNRIDALFYKTNYRVSELPSYDAKIAANPLRAFAQIPAKLRYQFLLEHNKFMLEGFVKGTVCRGQVALNVIDDYFWIGFYSANSPLALTDNNFLNAIKNKLQLPAEKGNTLRIDRIWSEYWQYQKSFLHEKVKFIQQQTALDDPIQHVWQDKHAALTIFRHTDSASVSHGFIGEQPFSMLMLDYPLFERIHYLLVAGFDVFGNIGHQLTTRLYMDFLRMEGEDNFLFFLPRKIAHKTRMTWYQGIRKRLQKHFKVEEKLWQSRFQRASFQSLEQLYASIKSTDQSNTAVALKIEKNYPQIEKWRNQIQQLNGERLKYIPDISFIRIKSKSLIKPLVFSLIHNKAYHHLSSLFEKDTPDLQRNLQLDSLTLLPWLEGAYPDFFIEVEMSQLEQFNADFMAIQDKISYDYFVEKYGIRRTNPDFWSVSDQYYHMRQQQEPISAGLFDLNRYENW